MLEARNQAPPLVVELPVHAALLLATSATSISLTSISGGRVAVAEAPKTLPISCVADSAVASEVVTVEEEEYVGRGCGFGVSSCCACSSSPRSSNCSRQRCGVPRDSHQSSSVPTSVKLALRLTIR